MCMRRGDPRFSNLKGISDLAKALAEGNLVETYLLVKLTLILPVATTTIERAFSSMKYIKDELRSTISDALLDFCLVCYFEKETYTPNFVVSNWRTKDSGALVVLKSRGPSLIR
ncbi:hypothetical protein H5410_041077 [Solanum commersonii]|uniref:HAT C-terminal dimerisation domain-containing protein n=1 Tax=Solanum commersonii TaxID=4109 RepID=A0A9J5XQK8_SOLCO|nr:hypothetical protein H5410_041077 [Solanum commersonii]